MVHGRLVVEGTPDTLAAAAGVTTVRFPLPDGVGPGELVVPRRRARSRRRAGHRVDADADGDLHALTGWALDAATTSPVSPCRRPTLEDMFLEVTAGAEAGDA